MRMFLDRHSISSSIIFKDPSPVKNGLHMLTWHSIASKFLKSWDFVITSWLIWHDLTVCKVCCCLWSTCGISPAPVCFLMITCVATWMGSSAYPLHKHPDEDYHGTCFSLWKCPSGVREFGEGNDVSFDLCVLEAMWYIHISAYRWCIHIIVLIYVYPFLVRAWMLVSIDFLRRKLMVFRAPLFMETASSATPPDLGQDAGLDTTGVAGKWMDCLKGGWVFNEKLVYQS